MNLSKKTMACAALLIALFSFTSTYAQRGDRGDTAAMRQRQEAMMQKMTTDLKLTPVQVDSLKAIQKEIGEHLDVSWDSPSAAECEHRLGPVLAAVP